MEIGKYGFHLSSWKSIVIPPSMQLVSDGAILRIKNVIGSTKKILSLMSSLNLKIAGQFCTAPHPHLVYVNNVATLYV